MKCPTNAWCNGRTRGCVPKHMARFGEVEPVAWLHAWGRMPCTPDTRHSRGSPTDEAVAAFMAEHGDAVRDVFARGTAWERGE